MLRLKVNNPIVYIAVASFFLIFSCMNSENVYGDNLSKLKLSQKFKMDIDPAKLIKVPIITMHVPFDIKNWPVGWRHLPVDIYSIAFGGGFAFGKITRPGLLKTGNFTGVVEVILDKGYGALISGYLEGMAFAVMEKGDQCMLVGLGTTAGLDIEIGSGLQMDCEQLYSELYYIEDIQQYTAQ